MIFRILFIHIEFYLPYVIRIFPILHRPVELFERVIPLDRGETNAVQTSLQLSLHVYRRMV